MAYERAAKMIQALRETQAALEERRSAQTYNFMATQGWRAHTELTSNRRTFTVLVQQGAKADADSFAKFAMSCGLHVDRGPNEEVYVRL